LPRLSSIPEAHGNGSFRIDIEAGNALKRSEANPASRYAMTGVFVARSEAGVRVAVTGAGADGVFRQTDMERELAANWLPDAITSVTTDPAALLSDLHATAEYRANLVKVMAKRAVAAA